MCLPQPFRPISSPMHSLSHPSPSTPAQALMQAEAHRPPALRCAYLHLLGFSRARNLLAWGVAGGAAYYLWVRPAQQDAARRKV